MSALAAGGLRENTSLNQFIRDRLEEKARELEEARKKETEEFSAFLHSLHGHAPKGWKFDREEANACIVPCLTPLEFQS